MEAFIQLLDIRDQEKYEYLKNLRIKDEEFNLRYELELDFFNNVEEG